MAQSANTSLSTANQAGGVSLAVVTVLIWVLSLRGIQIPDGVAAAITVVLSGAVHWLTTRVSSAKPEQEETSSELSKVLSKPQAPRGSLEQITLPTSNP